VDTEEHGTGAKTGLEVNKDIHQTPIITNKIEEEHLRTYLAQSEENEKAVTDAALYFSALNSENEDFPQAQLGELWS
jgi:uncharacterized membrane protein YvbJ